MAKTETKAPAKKAAAVNDGKIRGYNVKEKEMQVIENPVIEKTAKGGYMAKGLSKGGSKLCAILSEAKAKEFVKAGVKKKGL